ncbi:AAA family ATPase [Streptomyces sp. NPDC048560]|uniref:AAA family ATPase n=1 Tax=Streptomyces sp. NPDC048560 TaxID=3155488 RepID=UPI00342B1C40
MKSHISHLTVENFRTLAQVELPLGPLSVMVGPNGAGKSNVIHTFEFLADMVRTGLQQTLAERSGFPAVAYRGGGAAPAVMRFGLRGRWTEHATEDQPDEYRLSLLYRKGRGGSADNRVLSRAEHLVEHHTSTAPTTADSSSTTVRLSDPRAALATTISEHKIDRLHSVLEPPTAAASPFLSTPHLAQHLTAMRVFDVDVRAARRPAAIGFQEGVLLADNGANLADFLQEIRKNHPNHWDNYMADVTEVLPQIEAIDFPLAPGRVDRVAVALTERGLRGTTSLADASFGTVRLLCLLALFHDPNPPMLTCIEEIDHGIHPHALTLLASRLREASEHTQFLATSHSPAFADQLAAEELVICERDERGRSRIPAIEASHIEEIVEASEGLPLGDLWFSGALGGTAW